METGARREIGVGTSPRDAGTPGVGRHAPAFAVPWHERIEVDQLRDPFGGAVRHAGGHHPAIAVADQDHFAQVFETQHAQDVRDVRFEVDAGVREIAAFAESGMGGREQRMPAFAQQGPHLLPGPAPGPCAMNHHECRHAGLLQLEDTGHAYRRREAPAPRASNAIAFASRYAAGMKEIQ
jgi:hypothetical protein